MSANNLESKLAQEPLVSLVNVCERIKVYPYYFKAQMAGAYEGCYLREGVVRKLIDVANALPTGYFLVILDGWRSLETQQALVDMTRAQYEASFDDEEVLIKFISGFVATPSANPPSPHYTGGAVDLTIANEDGWLNMGTDFDAFTDEAAALYFEEKEHLTEEEIEIRDNRRLLRHTMEQAGFTIHPNEWWHFDYGNLRWARATNERPIYDGIELNN